MLIKNVSALLGEELDFVSKTDIQINKNLFKKIQPEINSEKNDQIIDCEGLLLIPGLINAHTHIGDSIGKDFTLDSSVDQRIHPVFGAKTRILKNTSKENIDIFYEKYLSFNDKKRNHYIC